MDLLPRLPVLGIVARVALCGGPCWGWTRLKRVLEGR